MLRQSSTNWIIATFRQCNQSICVKVDCQKQQTLASFP